VVDPFCGKGTVLAVANSLGLDALGVELSGKRCRAARKLSLAALTST
jgi:tRNA G10  N-methylase Trm11